MCEMCQTLLSEGLDLCVRARKLDAQDRANASIAASVDGEAWEASGIFKRYAKMHNEHWPDQQIATRSMTIPLWMQDQYERDLADWERRGREHLARGCAPTPPAAAAGEGENK